MIFDCFFLFLDYHDLKAPDIADIGRIDKKVLKQDLEILDHIIISHAKRTKNFTYIDAICDAIDEKYYIGNFRIYETMDHMNLRHISNNFQVR